MEQKDYNMEIVKILSTERKHARGIAKDLKINHMMINRKLKELSKKNVVDFDLIKYIFWKIASNQRYFS